MLIDTHSHLFVEEFKDDLPEVIRRAKEAGVAKIFMPNIDDTTIDAMLAVCETYTDYCYPMLGLHPTSVDDDYAEKVRSMKKRLVGNHPFKAIGEVGMDLYWDQTYLRAQQKALDEQIQWALEYDLPVILHCRDAFPALFEVMAPYRTTSLSGIFHSFTGTADEAAELLQYPHFKIGINGVVTFKKSTLPDALQSVSLDRLVLETDSPYLAPTPNRGKRNETFYILRVAERLGELYERSVEEIGRITTQNALKVFKMIE